MSSASPTAMSGSTTDSSSGGVTLNSPETISRTGDSTTTPIVIGASVASVALFLSLVFVIFYFVRRRRAEYHYYNDKTQFNLYASKDDYLPPEPSPPPPPYKDTQIEADIEAGMKPLIPPKNIGRPFGRNKSFVENPHRPAQSMLLFQDDDRSLAFPEQTHLKTEGGMF